MKQALFMTLVAFLIMSCGSGGTTPNNSSHANTSSNASGISFSLGGEAWSAQGYGQYSELDGNKIVSLLGTNTDKGMDQFGIKIHNFDGVGNYQVLSGNNGNFVLTFSRMNRETGQTTYYQVMEEQATVKVTAYDASQSTISGVFEFKVKDQDNHITEIKDGQFNSLQLVQVQ